ncbi:MAG: hypothetical protein M5T61_07660 [Acidimicrobiia bacterium]|nr:hypothetical protein [Acidimicrobiia bacterium]
MLGLNVPNVLEWIGLESAGRLIWSTLLLVGGCVVAYVLTTRPKSPEPVTWAQAVLGAVAVYALMILAYGTVPHEWLNYASSRMNWGEDTFFFRQGVIPFDMNRRAGADIGATIIYAVFLVVQVWLSVRWQKRPVAEAAGAPSEDTGPSVRKARRISMFGRPVTTRG